RVHSGVTYHALFRDFLQRRLKTLDPFRFLELHHRAALWFRENNRLDEAFDHYIHAESLGDAAELAERTASAYMAQGKPETVLFWAGQLANTNTPCPQLHYICGTIYLNRYQYDLASDMLNQAEHEFRERHDDSGVRKVNFAQANIAILQGNAQHAIDLIETILRQSELAPNVRGYAYSILGRGYFDRGNMKVALQYLEEALPLYHATGDSYAVANLLLSLYTAYIRIGHFDKASACVQEAVEILRALGSTADLIAPLTNLGYDYHLLGEYERAWQTFQEGVHLTAQMSAKRRQSYLWWSLGNLQRDRGAFDEAASLYQKALEAMGSNEPSLRCKTLLSFAILRRWQEHLEEGLTLSHEALVLAMNHQLPLETTLAQVSISTFRAQLGDPKKTLGALEASANSLKAQTVPMEWARTFILCAYAALLQGDRIAAYQYLKSASEGVVHETNLQPSAAELVHTPALKLFIQLNNAKLPALAKAVARLEAAQITSLPKAATLKQADTRKTYSLRVWVFGHACVERDGVSVLLSAWRSADARELFFYLLLKGAATRDQVGLLLWPESSSEQMRGKFHVSLHRARNAVGTHTILFEDERYFINPDIDVWCDALEFETLVQTARLSSPMHPHTEDLWRRVVTLYQGELLLSFDTIWILPRRETLHEMYLAALFALGKCIYLRGNFQEAITTLQRALAIDPYREDVHRAILMGYAALGQRSAIQRHAETLTQLLETDLGVAPSLETLTLVHSLLT
ncbi:MAG: tetratricopeptide repeat protein, partial [Chloroflexota bacterium]